MFLTKTEREQLTGRKQRAAQREWFKDNGYKFDVTADGWPMVLRSVVEKRLGGVPERAAPEPHWEALDGKKAA